MSRSQQETILAQVYQAFGQGTGFVRVSRKAVAALGRRYRVLITDAVSRDWDHQGAQVLERIRAIGRMAAQLTISRGATAIGPEECVQAAVAVEKASATPICPQHPETWQGGDTVGDPRDAVLGQLHVAFGQGCGALHAHPEAVRALGERYRAMLTEELMGRWDDVAAQLLERVRAVGRLAQHRASLAGEALVGTQVFAESTLLVEQVSGSPWCPSGRRQQEGSSEVRESALHGSRC
jgi:hypothetical protein